MPLSIELLPAFWTMLFACWLGAALLLCRPASPRRQSGASGVDSDPLTIFKPLPPLQAGKPPPALVRALESFVSQSDDTADLLLGIDPADGRAWEPVLARWRSEFPAARFQPVTRRTPGDAANPKISWQRELAPHARGRLWLWSDADVVAPPGFLTDLRAEFTESGARLLTCPYVVRSIPAASSALEALFVNVEFFPGVRLLGSRRRPVNFALGAAMLFDAGDFRQRADWKRLGETLADDNELGRQLGPSVLSRIVVETVPSSNRWTDSLDRYRRWHKTIRWCEPLGYAGQIVLMPALGWLALLPLVERSPFVVAGLLLNCLLESAGALAICARVGASIDPRALGTFFLWPLIRPAAWILSWLPLPVVWNSRRQRWRALRKLELFQNP